MLQGAEKQKIGLNHSYFLGIKYEPKILCLSNSGVKMETAARNDCK